MEAKYIVAICALSVFFILFLIFFFLLARKRKAEARLQAYLYQVYSEKNYVTQDYDSAADEDGLEERMPLYGREVAKQEAQAEQMKMEEVFSKKEIEGIEEITGNYIPE